MRAVSGFRLTKWSAPAFQPNVGSLVAAAAFGVVTWIALGLDFADSSARFSRLA
jgi:hypothetical protein